MRYHIWDTPDYKDLDKKLWAASKVTIGYSACSTAFIATANDLPKSGRAFLLLFGHSLIPNLLAVNVGLITAYVTAKLRGDVDNHWNYLPAALSFASTITLTRINASLPAGFRFGTYFVISAAVGILSKYSHNKRRGGAIYYYRGMENSAGAFGNLRGERPRVELIAQDWGRRQ